MRGRGINKPRVGKANWQSQFADILFGLPERNCNRKPTYCICLFHSTKRLVGLHRRNTIYHCKLFSRRHPAFPVLLEATGLAFPALPSPVILASHLISVPLPDGTFRVSAEVSEIARFTRSPDRERNFEVKGVRKG